MSPQLKLIALDADDLAVISAHVQDARVKACDIIWCARQKRLVPTVAPCASTSNAWSVS